MIKTRPLITASNSQKWVSRETERSWISNSTRIGSANEHHTNTQNTLPVRSSHLCRGCSQVNNVTKLEKSAQAYKQDQERLKENQQKL